MYTALHLDVPRPRTINMQYQWRRKGYRVLIGAITPEIVSVLYIPLLHLVEVCTGCLLGISRLDSRKDLHERHE
jgi:hypothetical protein